MLDALVWNFRRGGEHGLYIMLLRAGANLLVSRHSALNDAYVSYLDDLEKRRIARGEEA